MLMIESHSAGEPEPEPEPDFRPSILVHAKAAILIRYTNGTTHLLD